MLVERVREAIAGRWGGGDVVSGVARYALGAGGVLLRPLLLVRSALAVGGRLEDVLPAAVGVECAHVGGAIHDDLISRREGREAVHSRFGEGAAIIAGDALCFTWFEALADVEARAEVVVEVMRVQASAGRLACKGAALELALGVDAPVSAYLEMAHYKTAAMTSAACRIGALLAGAAPEHTVALAGFGEALGMALHLRGDLTRDLAQDPGENRPTLTDLLARHAHPNPGQQANDLAEHYTDRALAQLAQVPDGPHRRALEAWTHPGDLPSPRAATKQSSMHA
ncbi:geranylgeranyl diphosphate synthase, type I [Actinokineospora globicatena]|nr:geranylgeranyl diphosphate synthase, type I [Actinokineospora globicatena]